MHKSGTSLGRPGTGSAPDTSADGAVWRARAYQSGTNLGRPGSAHDTCADWHCTLSHGLAWVGLVARLTLAPTGTVP
jgi:hypothetical protein